MSVRRNLIANCIASGWMAMVNLGMVPIYLRYLGIEAFGLIGFFVALQAWLAMLDMGLTPTLNREMARFSAGLHTPQTIRDLLRSMEVVYASVALLIALALALAASWIATSWLNLATLSPATARQALAVMGVAMGLQWSGALYRSGIAGLQDQVWLSALAVATSTIRAAAIWVMLACLTPSVVAFAAVQCAVSLLETTLLAWRLHRRLPKSPQAPRFSLAALRSVWSFAAELTAIAVLATLLTQIDKLLLARLLPLEQFGYFTLAVGIASALSVVVGPIHNAAYPRLSELAVNASPREVAAEYHRFAQWLSMAMLPAALVLAVFAQEIVLLWTGNARAAAEAAPILAVWAAGTALNGVMHLPYAAQLAHGWARLTMVVNTISVLLLIPATLYCVPRYGAIAAAWIWVGINGGYVLFSIAVMHGRILRGEKWKWYLRDLLAPLAPAAAVVAGGALLRSQLGALSRPAELAFIVLTLLTSTLAVLLVLPAGQSLLKAAARVSLSPSRPDERS